MNEPLIERARMLMQADRPADAVRELTTLLAGDPESMEGHALMALSLARLDRYEEATGSARRAVGLAPDTAYAHWVLGAILCDRDRDKEALASAREAVRLDPDDPDYHALEASCLAGLSRWKEMRAAAERGLALDPGHVRCLNLRANALRHLGELDQASDALDTALARNPEDPDTHTSYGFARLQRRDYHGALLHFREALRLQPEHASARAGLVEALKARNPLYRPILWWILWSSRMSDGRGLIVILGLMFGVRALARSRPDAGPLKIGIGVVVVLYLLAVWTSWVGSALFDFLLLLRRDTRDVLTPRDSFAAKCVGLTVTAAPLAGLLLFIFGYGLTALIAAFAFLAVAIPVAGSLALPNRRARRIAAWIAFFCVALSVAGTIIAAVRGEVLREGGPPLTIGLALLFLAMVAAKFSTWLLLGMSFIKERR